MHHVPLEVSSSRGETGSKLDDEEKHRERREIHTAHE